MWVLENNIDLIVNLLGNQVSRRVIWIEWDMNKIDRDDWGEKMHHVLETMTSFLYSGQNVLVHCLHGLHRTGSLIVLWLALGLVGEEGVADKQGWLRKLTEAWETWKRGRQLRQATLDDRRGRDYESESWTAVTQFFSDMPIALVRELAGIWKTVAEAHAMQSPQSVQSRLPLQTPPADVVLVSREKAESMAEVEAKKRPAPKAWPKSMAVGAKPKSAPVLSAPPLQSPPGKKRPRGSVGVAAVATPTSGLAVFLKPTVKAEAKQKQTKQVQPRPKLEAKPEQTQAQQKKEKQPKQPEQPEQKKRKHKESQPSSSSVPSAQSQPSAESEPSEPLSKKQRAQRDYGPDWVAGEEWQDGDWSCRRCGNHNWRNRGFCNRNTCKRPRDADFCAGYDWYCRCGNFNKGHRQVCNRGNCKQPRAGNEQSP